MILLVLAGCRQLLGIDDPTVSAGSVDAAHSDTVVDIAPDVLAPASCKTRWQTGPVFGVPVALTSIDTSADEDHPFLLPDERTIYFTRGEDLYRASRPDTQQAFNAAVAETSLNSGATEGKVFVSEDGTRAFFASDRAGTTGGFDVWRGARTGGGNFSVDRMYLDKVNDGAPQLDPHLSRDLLRIYVSQGGLGGQRIAVGTRNNTSQDFSTPMMFPPIPGASDTSPTLTEDETVLVFASTSGGTSHLFYATRTTLNAPFSTPIQVPLAGTGSESSAHISADGCRLYFVSLAAGSRAISVATML